MNEFELEQKLKAARVPSREDDYWESFPRLVSAQLRAIPASRPVVGHRWLPRLAWGGGIAMACLLIGFALGHWSGRAQASDREALLQDGKVLREVLALFPSRVRAIVQDDRGMQLVLSEQADVPVSMPIYVRLCDGKRCSSLVTFSGQELEIAGQKVTVLSTARGGVIVAGARFAWSSERPADARGGLKIEGRSLKAIVL